MIALAVFVLFDVLLLKKLAKLTAFHRAQLSSINIRIEDLVVQILTLDQNQPGQCHSDFYPKYEK